MVSLLCVAFVYSLQAAQTAQTTSTKAHDLHYKQHKDYDFKEAIYFFKTQSIILESYEPLTATGWGIHLSKQFEKIIEDDRVPKDTNLAEIKNEPSGATLLHLGVLTKNAPLVELMLQQKNIDVNQKVKGEAPLHTIADLMRISYDIETLMDQPNIIKAFIVEEIFDGLTSDKRVNLDQQRSKDGKTALHILIDRLNQSYEQHNHYNYKCPILWRYINALKALGACPHKLDNKGRTAIQSLAVKYFEAPWAGTNKLRDNFLTFPFSCACVREATKRFHTVL